MTHLVTEVAQQVVAPRTLEETDQAGVQRDQVGSRQVEGNADGDARGRHAPLGRQIEVGLEPYDAGPLELCAKPHDAGLKAARLDRQIEVAQPRVEQALFVFGREQDRHGL